MASARAALAIAATGQRKFGLEGVGEPAPGSRLLANAIKSGDPRPLWVSVWGGANTLLQALRECRAEMRDDELAAALAKLRVYSISDQDDAGPAARREFPSVMWIVDPRSYPFDYRDYWKSTWNGMAGDVRGEGRKLNLPFVELADNEWLKPHVMDMGPLGKCYPPHIYSMEGDTTKGVLRIAAKRGDKVALSAEGLRTKSGRFAGCDRGVLRLGCARNSKSRPIRAGL